MKTVLEEGNFSTHPQYTYIYNYNITQIDLKKSTKRVVMPKYMRKSHSRQVASIEVVSIHCWVNIAGATVILKNRLPVDKIQQVDQMELSMENKTS